MIPIQKGLGKASANRPERAVATIGVESVGRRHLGDFEDPDAMKAEEEASCVLVILLIKIAAGLSAADVEEAATAVVDHC